MHSHRPFSTLRRCLIGGAALAALTTAFYSFGLAQDPMQPMGPGGPVAPPPAQGAAMEPRIEITETATLRSATGKRLTKVFASRPSIVRVETDPADPTVVKVTGLTVGRVDITLVDETGVAEKVTVRVLPDMSYVRETIKKHYPRTNLAIERVGENTVVVTGDVEMAEQISGILLLVESMVGKGYAINNMRLAGVVQVQLEVCIAQVRRREIRNMGFNWLQSSPNSVSASTVGGRVIPQPDVGSLTPRTILPGFVEPFGALGTRLQSANLAVGLFQDDSAFFAYLEALRSENLVKVIANPTVTTLSGRPANFVVGSEEPYGTAGSGGGQGTGIEFKQVGTFIRFLPIALGNGKLRIEIQPEFSSVQETITQANIVAPRTATTRVETTVEMESGQTMAIGGLIQNVISGSTAKVPVLGDLPFVGAAFRQVSYDEEEIELLVIVTPHVVDPLDCNQRPGRLPGQETRTPTDFELFLEGILEAPRGQREIAPGGHYKPAHYHAPAHCYPYGTPNPGKGHGGYGQPCVTGGCGNGGYGVQPAMRMVEVNETGTIVPASAEQPQGTPQDTNPVLPPQQPVSPAVYVPESNQPQTEQVPPSTAPLAKPEAPATGQEQTPSPVAPPARPEAPPQAEVKEANPVPSEPVKPME